MVYYLKSREKRQKSSNDPTKLHNKSLVKTCPIIQGILKHSPLSFLVSVWSDHVSFYINRRWKDLRPGRVRRPVNVLVFITETNPFHGEMYFFLETQTFLTRLSLLPLLLGCESYIVRSVF